MQTIALVSRKGGVSKTTLAAHIAVLAAEVQPTIIADTDPQGSLKGWWKDREADNPSFLDVPVGRLPAELAKVKSQPGLVIIDTPPFDSGISASAIQIADLVVIPVKPSPHDLRSVATTVAAVKKANKPFLLVLTQAVSGAALTDQAYRRLEETGPVATAVMHNRVSFAGSMTDGRTVIDTDRRGRAAHEIAAIYNAVMAALLHTVEPLAKGGKNG